MPEIGKRDWGHLAAYLFFGVCTTLVNVAAYGLFTRAAGWETVPAAWGAWLLAVLFAFVTNKRFVFRSGSREWKVLGREAAAFFSCRLLTGALDAAVMYVTVELWLWPDLHMKAASNVIVIVLNYAAGRWIVFRK